MIKVFIKAISLLVTVAPIFINGQGSNELYKSVRKNQSLINDVYRQVITNYVDEIDLDSFTKLSIKNMLSGIRSLYFLHGERKKRMELKF